MNISAVFSNVSEVSFRIARLTDGIRAAVTAELEHDMADLAQYVVTDKLSGQVLNKKTGALAAAVSARVTGAGDTITGEVYVGAQVPYARILEQGGQTPAHMILPVKAQYLHFFGARDGQELFLKRVNHPGSKIPAFGYLSSALADKADEIVAGVTAAINKGSQV